MIKINFQDLPSEVELKLAEYEQELVEHNEYHKSFGTYTNDTDTALSYLLAKIALLELRLNKENK